MKSRLQKKEISDQERNPESEINEALDQIIKRVRNQNKALSEVLKKIDPGLKEDLKR